MVEKSLAQLREEKKRLTKNLEGAKQKRLVDLEKRELKKEIRALKHPRSVLAIKDFLKAGKKTGLATVRIIKSGARSFDQGLRKIEAQKRSPTTRKRLVSNSKKKTKKKTRKK